MKIITWNVNGLRAVERKNEIQSLIENQEPDILLLQEIKGKKEQFSKYLTDNAQYRQFYHSAEKPGYAGTGIWVRHDFLKNTRRIKFNMHVPHMQSDQGNEMYADYMYAEDKQYDFVTDVDEGRVSHLSFVHAGTTYDFASIYFPNGGKSKQAWKDKLVFFDRVLEYMNALRKCGHEVIVGGDMNVAHTEIDIARPKENDGKIGFHPDERAWVDRVMANDWVDVWRAKNPKVVDMYSWWDMKTRARDRNVGWRIDYFFIDKHSLEKIEIAEYLNEQMGSDHCPLMMQTK